MLPGDRIVYPLLPTPEDRCVYQEPTLLVTRPMATAFQIRPATMADRPELVRISKTHRAGQGFTNALMFSGQVHFDKGWLRVAYEGGKILGFTCIRVKSRTPELKLYYIIVDSNTTHRGVGQALLNDMIANAPATHRTIKLDCLKDNEPALKFYAKNGFTIVGESLAGKGHVLEKKW